MLIAGGRGPLGRPDIRRTVATPIWDLRGPGGLLLCGGTVVGPSGCRVSLSCESREQRPPGKGKSDSPFTRSFFEPLLNACFMPLSRVGRCGPGLRGECDSGRAAGMKVAEPAASTPELRRLTVPEARSPTSRWQRSGLLLRTGRGTCPRPLCSAGGWLSSPSQCVLAV